MTKPTLPAKQVVQTTPVISHYHSSRPASTTFSCPEGSDSDNYLRTLGTDQLMSVSRNPAIAYRFMREMGMIDRD